MLILNWGQSNFFGQKYSKRKPRTLNIPQQTKSYTENAHFSRQWLKLVFKDSKSQNICVLFFLLLFLNGVLCDFKALCLTEFQNSTKCHIHLKGILLLMNKLKEKSQNKDITNNL